MSDFLQRLAQRSLGMAPTLEAWTPGLFGPTEGRDRLELDVTPAPAQTHVGTMQPMPPTEGTPTPVPLLPPEASRPVAASSRPSTGAPESSVDSIEPTTPPRVQPQGSSLAPLPARATPHQVAPQTTPALPQMLVEQGESPGTRPTAVATPQAGVEPLVPRERQPRAEWPSIPPVAPTPAPTTTVKVSIGRIEVRAIVAAPTKRPDRPRAGQSDASRLTLSEYLRQGSGAAR